MDSSLRTLPLVGFLPPLDPRMTGTVAAIERELSQGGFLLRYRTDGHDGLSGHEGVFLLCSFWLVEVYALQGRMEDAEALLGNFPQAFSHVGLVMAALALSRKRVGDQRPLHE